MKFLYKTSLFCGLLPLCGGISIYLTWLNIRADWLELAGLFTIFGGLVLFAIGMTCLAIYFKKAKANKVKGYLKKSMVALIILISNFPISALILGSTYHELSTSTVKIENYSKDTIENLYFSDRINIYYIGQVPPETTIKKEINFTSEGSVHYFFEMNNTKYQGIIFGYVTSGMSFSAKMVITEFGKVEIID